jgi:hypothetical protein
MFCKDDKLLNEKQEKKKNFRQQKGKFCCLDEHLSNTCKKDKKD